MIKTATLSDGQSVEFSVRPDDPVLGDSNFEIRIITINGHTFSLERYSPDFSAWTSTGDDSISDIGISSCHAPAGGTYRIVCSGGTGSASVEIESR